MRTHVTRKLRSPSYDPGRILLLVAALAAGAGAGVPASPPAAAAQEAEAGAAGPPSGPELERALALRRALVELGPTLGPAVWPGFRPDTIPVLLVYRDRGRLLLGWDREPPEGYVPAADGKAAWLDESVAGAASMAVRLGGRSAAQVSMFDRPDPAEAFGRTVHEAFHVFEAEARSRGGAGSLGTAENAYLVSRYPEFDAGNAAAAAVEAELLAAALERPDAAERIAREFLAVREARHRRLGHELAEFEAAAELNEGLAEYALVRARQAFEDADPRGELARRLRGMAGQTELSVRLRFYATGAAQALLLDRLWADGWKEALSERPLTLHDALAEASGYREAERALRRAAARRVDGAELARQAEAAVRALRERRRERVREVLDAPGVPVRIEASELGRMGICGLDPQNLLQAGGEVIVHTRWVRPCVGSALQAEFNTPVVQDDEALTLQAVSAPGAGLVVTAGGEPVRLAPGEEGGERASIVLEAADLRVEVARGVLRRDGQTWIVKVSP